MSNPLHGVTPNGVNPNSKNSAGAPLKKIFNNILPLFCAAVVAVYIGYICSFDIVIEASVNGVFCGYVESLDLFGDEKREIVNQISESLGENYKFDCEISYSFTHTKDPVYLTESECASILHSIATKDFCDAYVLYVDDVEVAAYENYDGLYSLIMKIESDLLESSGENFNRVEISNRIRIENQISAKSRLKTLDEINVLLNPLANEQDAAVTAAPVLMKTAAAEPVTVRISAFSSATPGKTDNTELIDTDVDYGVIRQQDSDITDGQDLTLNYKFIRSETVDEVILYDIKYIEDYGNFIGTDTIAEEGSDGLRTVTYEISCDADGKEIEKTEFSQSIIIPAVDKIIMMGAAEIPEAVSTGTLIWPCAVNKGISSGYGARTLNGLYDFHLGIDIPDNEGAEIYASDGGEVTWAGYTPSYGYSVRIQHKDNFITVYAHLKKISVSVGDMVYQGQELGLMGHTGVAYGTHLHYEVRIGSFTVNPIKYLPKLEG